MIRLDSPLDGDEDVSALKDEVTQIIRKARPMADRKAMLAEIEQIRARIEKYIECRGNPEKIGVSPFLPRWKKVKGKKKEARKRIVPAVGELLFRRYKSGQAADREVYKRVAEVAVGYCPYCGLSIRPKPHGKNADRDHVLPRSKYPEFSVLRVNLVLSCDDCNDCMKAGVLNEGGQWLFVHPYFDDFLNSRVLKVNLASGSGVAVLSFEISVLDPEQTEHAGRLGRHFEALDLNTRYVAEVREAVKRTVRSHRRYVADGFSIAKARESLRALAKDDIAERPNDPLGLALLELAGSPSLSALLT